MRVLQLFLLKDIKPFILILFALSASNAMAYMKINYKTDDLHWFGEQMYSDGTSNFADFFQQETINFDITLLVPDFEFSGSETMYLTFEDPVINVKASNFFDSIVVSNSQAGMAFFPFEEFLVTEFFIRFDILDATKPEKGTSQGGTFEALTIITEGIPNNINQVNFNYYLDNWIYKRHEMEFELSSSVQFTTETSWLTIEKISVPAPPTPTLLLTGLVFMLIARARIKPNT